MAKHRDRLRALLVEDNSADARLIMELLKDAGGESIDLVHVDTLHDALDLLSKERFDVVLLDLFLPDGEGLPTISKLLSANPSLPVVVLTAHGDESLGIKAVGWGAQDYLIKDRTDGDLLMRSIHYAVERKQAEEALRRRSEVIIKHQTVLLDLARMDHSDFESAVKHISKMDAKTLGVDRVSVWLFSHDDGTILCRNQYRLSEDVHGQGRTLQVQDAARYIEALKESRIIAAEDAYADPRTQALAEQQLKPDGVRSRLDVPIWVGGEVVGVVSHEQTAAQRNWTLEEQEFAASIADMISLALQASERRKAQEALRKAYDELEMRVAERTAELEGLLELSRKISSVANTDDLFELTFACLAKIVDFDIGVGMVTLNGHKPHFYAVRTRPMSNANIQELIKASLAEYNQVRGTATELAEASPKICSLEDLSPGQDEVTLDQMHKLWGGELTVFGEASGFIHLYISETKPNRQGSRHLFSAILSQLGLTLQRLQYVKQAEHSRLASILNSMRDGIVLLDLGGNITAINPAGEQMIKKLSHQARENDRIKKLGPVNISEIIGEVLDNGATKPIRREVTTDSEPRGIFNLTFSEVKGVEGEITGVVLNIRDVTEEREAQEQLFLNSKLASLGELAAGVAHEVNNPLTTVIGYAQYHLMSDIDPEIREDFRKIYEDGKRAQTIVKSLLSFARTQAEQRSDVDVNEIVKQLPNILGKQLLVNNIKLRFDLQDDLAKLHGNSGEILQILLNLIQNAKDAISDAQKGSMITIRTRRRPDDTLELIVQDDGPGMSESVQKKIFDPFFTTKPVGRGTGLGLSITHKIVQGYGGEICVRSQLGQGARFIIKLPLVSSQAEHE